MSVEPESLILQVLRDVRGEIGDMRAEIGSLRADVAADMIGLDARQEALHKQTREQIVGLGRAVVEYYTSVIRHRIIISDLEARRVEQHLNLSGADGH